MPKVICPMPQCINRGEGEECQAETIEMMFGLVIQLSGRGAEAFTRCAQHMTFKDIADEPSTKPQGGI
jgi:hypothetical protein